MHAAHTLYKDENRDEKNRVMVHEKMKRKGSANRIDNLDDKGMPIFEPCPSHLFP
jgi:hypothetical protein